MLSLVLNSAARSRRARVAVESFPGTRGVVDRFVAGETSTDAIRAAKQVVNKKMFASLDLLGEDINHRAAAAATRDAYVALLYSLHDAEVAAATEVSLKLSAVGQSLPRDGAAIALEYAQQICAAAEAVGTMVTLDMEDHTTIDSTLSIGAQLRQDFPRTGTVLQSNLRRTAGDLVDLSRSGHETRVRLVKGAYKEPETVAFQRKLEVDRAYARDIETAMRSSLYPMIASHDPSMLDHTRAVAVATGRAPSAFEMQMLYGIRTDLQDQVVKSDMQMRVYIPFGSDWYAYFMRRLAERPANVAFFLRALVRR